MNIHGSIILNNQKMEIIHTSLNWCIHKMLLTHTTEALWVMLQHMNFTNNMLVKEPKRKDHILHCISPLVWNVQKKWIYRDKSTLVVT
jgi:hypothetical protein